MIKFFSKFIQRPRIIHGYKFYIPEDMMWCFESGEYYEKNVFYWSLKILSLFEKPVVFDVGANIGYYSIILSEKTKMVFSFEPVSSTFRTFKRNVQANKIRNIEGFRMALSNKSGEAVINLYNSCGNDSLFLRNVPDGHPLKKIGEERINIDTLDCLYREKKITQPDFIKIDVEGAELDIIKGAKSLLQISKPIILFEFADTTSNDAGYSKGEILNELGVSYFFYGISENVNDLKIALYNEDFCDFPVANIIAVPDFLKDKFEELQ